MISLGEAAFPLRNVFFRRDALKEQFGKEPSTVRCLAVKSALLGTRHPRKEKEAALQNVTGEPACLYCKILMTTQSEMETSERKNDEFDTKMEKGIFEETLTIFNNYVDEHLIL